MSVIFTAVAKVKDWRALQKLDEKIIRDELQAIGAVGYEIYRNTHDASQALLLIELPDQDDIHHVRATVYEALNGLDKVRVTDEWVWEATGWEPIKE
jgi:hypothetical protein